MATPAWSAARNGLPGDTTAIDASAQINQFLGTHGITAVYAGKPILTPSGTGVSPNFSLSAADFDQPFTLSGTSVGRVVVPVIPVGNGADLQVSLYTDASGVPGTRLATTRIPASWITALAATEALVSSDFVYSGGSDSDGAEELHTAQFNTAAMRTSSNVPWQSPAVDASGGGDDSISVQSGQFFITMGGFNAAGAPTAFVWVTPWLGGSQFGPAVPQASLPVGTGQPSIVITPDAVVVTGGLSAAAVGTANVFVAGWDSTTGELGSWSAQAALPQALVFHGIAASDENIYVVGGLSAAGPAINNVYWSTVQNGQIATWNAGPPLPTPIQSSFVAVIGGCLVVCGGSTTPSQANATNAVWYCTIHADGSLGAWQSGPSMPVAVTCYEPNMPLVGGTVLIWGGTTTAGLAGPAQLLPFTGNGPGNWSVRDDFDGGGPILAFQVDAGTWEAFSITGGAYSTAEALLIPTVSVPMPVTGLTNGATYHVVLHQQGGDRNNYLLTWDDVAALPDGLGESAPGSGSWTYFPGFAIPISVYDLSSGGQVLHTWEDSGSRVTTLIYATTPDARLLGIAEAIQFLDGTVDASVCTVDYPGTWPAEAWPPLGVTQL